MHPVWDMFDAISIPANAIQMNAAETTMDTEWTIHSQFHVYKILYENTLE